MRDRPWLHTVISEEFSGRQRAESIMDKAVAKSAIMLQIVHVYAFSNFKPGHQSNVPETAPRGRFVRLNLRKMNEGETYLGARHTATKPAAQTTSALRSTTCVVVDGGGDPQKNTSKPCSPQCPASSFVDMQVVEDAEFPSDHINIWSPP
ncbi:hypothetical protein VFPPC_05670 [Pochonia chlamydosporia 170]|uniref:Uncharacterized protein n=1 Tax=Pochonia chlamydosporia 170 TaxID=1380566 RepID=A0A179FFT9_METCM|nr:hypothetical protein VFPPC_05670 [Pochonia chlamydosporia 170]OAQ64392.1 hypothetical protein VFPPC_05670 [Pochonia chlamydosporia 170]